MADCLIYPLYEKHWINPPETKITSTWSQAKFHFASCQQQTKTAVVILKGQHSTEYNVSYRVSKIS